jgi:hypothetical protein
MNKIKDFSKFSKDSWEEFSLNILNSMDPNPLEILEQIEDISLEWTDDGWGFVSYLRLVDPNDEYDVFYPNSALEYFRLNVKNNKMIDYYKNRAFSDLISKSNYRPTYKLRFISKSEKQGESLDVLVNSFYYPMIKRLKNEFQIQILNFDGKKSEEEIDWSINWHMDNEYSLDDLIKNNSKIKFSYLIVELVITS